MKAAEGAGRTVEEAIRDALRALGAKREDVDLMVLDEGSRGVLGLGAREARVRLTLLSAEGEEDAADAAVSAPALDAASDAVTVARDITSSLIEAMGFHGTIRGHEDAGAVLVSITGQQLAPLIGRHGQTLEALELVVNLIVARRLGHRVPVVVDAERYRERRREALQALASRTASRVRRSGTPVALEPMSASERRVVHTALAEEAGVSTHSEGEGDDRHVVITLRGDDAASPVPRRTQAPAPEAADQDSAGFPEDLPD